MKNLNLFRKSARGSEGSTLASAVVRPSFDRRSTVVKHLAFMLLFLLGSLNVWGETATYTFTDVSTPTTATTDGFTFTFDKGSGTAPAWNAGKSEARLYAKGSLTIDGGENTITSIVFTYVVNKNKSGKAPTITSVSGTSNSGTWDESSNTWSDATGDNEIVFSTSGEAGNLGFKSVTITYSTGGGGKTDVTDEQLSWSAASATVTLGETPYSLPSLTNTIPVSVSYQSTDETVATISNMGVVSILKAGSTTIKAVYAGSETLNAKTVSYTLTVSPTPLTPIAGGIVDELVISDLLTSGSGYQSFSDKQASNTGHSDAVYAGKVCISGSNIQMNTIGTNTSAGREIATTTSGGYAKRVQAIWGGTNTADRKLTIYGSNSAYSGSETATSGTKLGELTYTAGSVYEYIDITGDYEYIQIVASGAMYMSQINITWLPKDESKVATPSIDGTANFYPSTDVTITCGTDDADIYYTTNGATPTTSSTKYTGTFSVNNTTTIKAIAVKDGMTDSEVAEATFTRITPLTIENVLIGIEETEGDAFLLNDVTVTYVSGTNIYVKDASGYILVYDKNSAITGAENGKVLHGLWGKAKLYNGLPEISTVTQAPAVTDGSAVVPEELNAYPTDADLNKYVTLEGVTFASAATLSGSVTNIDGTFKETTLILRNQFKLNGVSVETEKSYRVVGVVQKYNETYQVYPITITEIVEAGAPEAPTFSVVAGTYTSVQSVELSCVTEDAKIYYTTDGSTPTSESTEYTTAINVGENMTIKAIAVKDDKESTLASATYVINLPENEEVRKTWDLSTDSYDADPNEDLIQWSAAYVTMTNAKGSGTKVNNYIPTAKTSTRFYSGNKLTITPNNKSLTTIVFTATSDSYATALANSTWTNATAVASGTTVTVTATDGDAAVSAVIGGTCGFTAVQVNYITDTRASAGLSWSTDAIEITLGELFSTPTLNNPNSIAEGEITIESNNTALAIVADGVVSLVENATGTATITASFAGNALYKATEVSYTIKVNKPLSPWASVYSSNVTLSTEGGTSASAAKVIFDETEGGYDAIKAGTGSVSGAVKITVPAQATTLHYHAYGWNGEDVTLSITAPTGVTISPESQAIISNAGVSSNSPFTLKNDPDPKNDAYYSVDLSGNDEEIELTFTATTGNRFVLFGVNQEGGIVPVLQSIEISGDLTTKTGYKAGDALDLDGLTVMATYTLGGTPQTPVDITDDAELAWSYDPLVENQTSVTITASYKGQTDDITINDLESVASADPVIYVQPSLNVNFGTVAPNASVENKTITVTLTNVANATATLGGTNPEAFSIDKTALVNGDVITISVASTANVGTYSATITISDDAEAATSKVVNLSLIVEDVETPVLTTSKWVAAEAADLVDGAEVLITGMKDAVTYAMGADRGNNRFAVAGTLNEGVFTPGENTMSFTLVAQGDGTFALRTSNGKYLYAGGTGNSNYLNTKAYAGELDANAKWNITISSIIATSTNRNDMRFNYNNNNPALISCYQSTSTNPAIALYVPQPAPTPVYETVRENLEPNRHYTVCLPKNITHIKGATFWNLQYKNAGNTEVYLVEETAPEAGKPYIIQATDIKLEVVYGEEIAANPVENGALRGTFTGINETDFAALEGTVYLLINNAIRPRTAGNYLDANRAYVRYDLLTVPQTQNFAPGKRVRAMPMAPQVATGVDQVPSDQVPNTKVLIDGQLFILRGEKMYNVQGQLVK